MALLNSTVRPSQQASDIGGQRGRLLQSVFPGMVQTPTATSPATPANTREFAMRAPTENHQSAASRAAYAVQQHLIANPVKPVVAPVKSTRANSQLTQSAGTINTNYVNSAAEQGFTNVTPPNIFRGTRSGSTIPGNTSGIAGTPFRPGGLLGGNGPNRTRESFRDAVFTPPPTPPRTQLFAPPVPAASALLQQPLAPQVGVPINTFPPRNQFLNYLFPR